MSGEKFPCPCCGYRTLSEPASGSYELCDECFWEDDGVQLEDPTYRGGANKESLNEARENFVIFGSCSLESSPHARPPRPEEADDRASPLRLDSLGGRLRFAHAIVSALLGRDANAHACIVALSTLPLSLDEDGEHALAIFKAAESELASFPLGAPRAYWSATALAERDRERDACLVSLMPSIRTACAALLRKLESALAAT